MKPFNEVMLAHERAYMKRVLKECHLHVRNAIKISGLSTSQFYRVLERTGVKLPEYGTDARPSCQRGHE